MWLREVSARNTSAAESDGETRDVVEAVEAVDGWNEAQEEDLETEEIARRIGLIA